MAYPAKYHPSLCDKLPEMFADGSSITQVCVRKLHVSRETYYEWKDLYPEFRVAASYGEQLSQAFHEEELDEGARGKIKNFNATAKIFQMKNRFRESYHDEPPVKSLEKSLVEQFLDGELVRKT